VQNDQRKIGMTSAPEWLVNWLTIRLDWAQQPFPIPEERPQ